jgi:8-hydroxy-5-deazaflavin:NADPH oxidoreductase
MNIAVLGTGAVGQALAGRLHDLGHTVVLGTRDPDATRARTDEGSVGPWLSAHPGVGLAGFAEAADGAELVVLAAGGGVALDVLAQAGAGALGGKPLVDITNPLDFSQGFPPTLFVKDTDSLAEQIQRTYPAVRVVKSLNTLTAALMVDPRSLPASSTVFVAGDDADAKATVVGLLESFGHDDVLDLGDLTAARGTEMWLPLWLRLMQSLGTAQFNLKVVR